MVEAMNTLLPERHKQSESYIKVKVSRRTQKVQIYLAEEGSRVAFFGTDLGHILGSDVRNGFGVMMRRKGPHKPEVARDFVRMHSLMINTDLTECNTVSDKTAPMLRCFYLSGRSRMKTL